MSAQGIDVRMINVHYYYYFCCPESVAMTLKIICGTYAHCVTLGSRYKMACNHRVTDLEKNPVRISKDEAATPLSVVGPLFISSLSLELFHLSRTLLGTRGFNLFRSVYSRPHQGGCLLLGVLFYFSSLSLFVLSWVKIKKFCSF